MSNSVDAIIPVKQIDCFTMYLVLNSFSDTYGAHRHFMASVEDPDNIYFDVLRDALHYTNGESETNQKGNQKISIAVNGATSLQMFGLGANEWVSSSKPLVEQFGLIRKSDTWTQYKAILLSDNISNLDYMVENINALNNKYFPE